MSSAQETIKIPILTAPEVYPDWFRAIRAKVGEEWWPYFEPEGTKEFKVPEEPEEPAPPISVPRSGPALRTRTSSVNASESEPQSPRPTLEIPEAERKRYDGEFNRYIQRENIYNHRTGHYGEFLSVKWST